MKNNYKFLLIIAAILLVLVGFGTVNASTTTSLDISNIEVNTSADIVLSETGITSNKSSISISGTTATINNGGEYSISGILEDGQIIINATDEDVNLVLDSVAITNSSGPAIYVVEAQDVLISLKENSTNILSDGDEYDDLNLEEDVPNAVIYSMSDLDIVGSEGAGLKVVGNYKDGIASKDDLDITNLDVEITAEDDGLVGKDSVEIVGSTLSIDADGDAIKSDNEDEGKGFITVDNSSITINAGDDGIHAVNLVEIYSGDIDIIDSFEGIEGKVINIHDGFISIVSSDDGINVSDSSSSLSGGAVLADASVNIYGGNITMDTGGDGFDSNGNATMTGGTLIVNGPVDNRNGSIDVNGTFNVSGGTIIAIGSSGMAETPDETSSQYAIQVNFDETQVAGTSVGLVDANGAEVFSYDSIKQFQSVVFSSQDLQAGASYTFLINGKEHAELGLNSVVTTYGEVAQMRRF